MSQYIIVKVNTDEEMNLRYEQDFENYDGMYVPVSDKPRYEKVGELIRCKDCFFYEKNTGVLKETGNCWYLNTKGFFRNDDDFCSRAERRK
jgi:hypothetical protein